MYYYSWLHLATCFGHYTAIIRPTRNSNGKVYSTGFSKRIPLFTLKDCKLRGFENVG